MEFTPTNFDDDAQFIIQTSDEDSLNDPPEPQTEFGKDTGVLGFTFWVRLDEREFPIYSYGEMGAWLSSDVSVHRGVEEYEVSEEFKRSIAGLPDRDYGAGPMAVPQEDWDELTDEEQVLVHSFRASLIEDSLSPEQEKMMHILIDQSGLYE